MVKRIFAQLENLVRDLQVRRLRRTYPDSIGIKIGNGVLWQHPGRFRQEILRKFWERVALLDKVV